MALSLVVSPEPLADRPRVRLDVTGTNVVPNAVGPNSLVNLYRTHEDGRKYPVITEADARLSAGAGTWFDYHAPFGQQVTYSVAIGTVEQSGLEQAGYWNYAPPPHMLPSQFMGLGQSGDPLLNGWRVDVGTVAKSALSVKLTPNASGVFIGSLGPMRIEGGTPGGTVRIQIALQNSPNTLYTPSIELAFYDANGNIILPSATVADADEWPAGDIRTFTTTATLPALAATAELLVNFTTYPTNGGGYCLVQGIMLSPGSSTPAFPNPEFVPLQLVQSILTSDETWLISPSLPDLSCAVHAVKGVAPQTQPSQSGLQVIIGRKNPIAITAGRRAGRRGSIVVRSDSVELDSQIETLMSTDGPILINPQGGFERDMPWLWVQPGDLEGPINRAEYTGYEYREYTIPFTEVDQPEVYSNALWSWDNVTATYATWSDVTANYATWSDLQTDTRLT